MNRLQSELQRLYAPADDGVRALVLELVAPSGWDALSAVWRGVQVDLDLPAPAIAVSGSDALQLWFSLAQPASPAQAQRFLQAVCRRYLADVPAARVRTHPALAPGAALAATERPPAQVAPERWSAFIAADLAPVFSGEPWLDHPPGVEAQAELLARIVPIAAAAFQAADERLQPAAAAHAAASPADGASPSPRQFLRSVMNDPHAPLALRVEAAKALLPRDG